MSWCDKLASTPSIGLKLDPHYISGPSIFDTLSPVIDTWTVGDSQGFTIEKVDATSVQVTTEDGFIYVVEPTKASVIFAHRMKLKQTSAGPPVAELISEPRLFTVLLPEVSKRLMRVMSLINAIKPRMVKRVGVVCNTVVDPLDAPPGILRFAKYVGYPWKGNLHSYHIQITGEIDSNSDYEDRCIHALIKPEDKEGLLSITLDWQRTFKQDKTPSDDELKKLIQFAEYDALHYFEDVAEGGRFDAQLNSKAV